MQKGFTVLELLVVIAIIGVLSSIVLVSYNGYTDKARIAKTLQWASSVNHSLGDQAVGAWTFDNISGATVYDDSGNNNNGTAYGDPAVVNGVVGKGLSFDGTDDYVEVGNSSSLSVTNEMTIGVWIKTNSSAQQGIIQKGPNCFVHPDKFLYYNGSTLVLRSGSPPYYIPSAGITLYNGAWHYIAVTAIDGQPPKFYVDSKDISASSEIYHKTSNNGYALLIGGSRWACSDQVSGYFNGLIDDVRIFSAALSQAQIQQHYADGLNAHQSLAKQ